MQYVYSGIVTLIVGILVFIIQSLIRENHRLRKEKEAKEREENAALKDGVLCLLRVKLIEYHAKYVELDRITSHGLENWLLMYRAYKALGGNGMIEHMKEEIEKLHIK